MHLLRKHWWWILAAIALLVVAAYFVNFGPHSGGFSQATEDWGHFGEYVGGVFGIMAFIGVLITIDLQRTQLDQLSKQSTVDELMQLCRILAKNIDDRLDQPLPNAPNLRERELVRWANCSDDYRGLVSAVASPNPKVAEQLGPQVTDHGAHILVVQALQKAASEMDQLARCAQEVKRYGGSLVIVDYYLQRYGDVAFTIVQFDVELNTGKFWERSPGDLVKDMLV
jgi:hypothetical protein